MEFSEKSRPVGRLEIIKIDKRTGLEEVVYDESNVITGGLGRSIAQLMSTPCEPTPCEKSEPVKKRRFEFGSIVNIEV